MAVSVDEKLKELIQFQKNFQLSYSSISEEEDTETSGIVRPSRKSLEQKTEIQSLKEFHRSFNLVLESNGDSRSRMNGHPKPIPNSLDINQQNLRKKKRRRRRPNESIADFTTTYELTKEKLGSGARSTVETCRHRKTGREYAVKIIPKTSPDVRDRVLKEVEILHICARNRHFIQIEDLFETGDKFFLVSEKMAGPLLALIQKKERFTEREASLVTKEVASALEFLHDQGIAHRDLKPENILCEREDEVTPVKICDFDLSSMVTNQSRSTTPNLFTPVGSAEFMAPEVVDAFHGEVLSYDKKCDLWSLGVLLYMMLSGSPPFYGRCGKQCGWERGGECDDCQSMLLQRITRGEYGFPPEVWCDVSIEAKDLISRLLEKNVEKRLSAKQVLKHSWLEKDAPETPLTTPSLLRRNPSIPEELSFYAASCLKCTRKMSVQYERRTSHPFTLSPPGSSDLALRREYKS